MAHEVGHQAVSRNTKLRRALPPTTTEQAEEILASLIASLLGARPSDRESLSAKALHDTLNCGLTIREATELISELRTLLENVL